MSIIKKFELFDFRQTMPYTSDSALTLYYHCDNCDFNWEEYNETCRRCKKCKSEEIEELSKSEWDEVVKLDDLTSLYSLGEKKYKKNVN